MMLNPTFQPGHLRIGCPSPNNTCSSNTLGIPRQSRQPPGRVPAAHTHQGRTNLEEGQACLLGTASGQVEHHQQPSTAIKRSNQRFPQSLRVRPQALTWAQFLDTAQHWETHRDPRSSRVVSERWNCSTTAQKDDLNLANALPRKGRTQWQISRAR